MSKWKVDTERKPGILWLEMEGTFELEEMISFVRDHNLAVDRFAGKDYRVFCDIRNLKPLSQQGAELMQKAKDYSNAHPNFRGSAVWVASALIAMQHRRTSTSGGVISTELISENEQELWAHLAKVHRQIDASA